jgi:hypothetical protein
MHAVAVVAAFVGVLGAAECTGTHARKVSPCTVVNLRDAAQLKVNGDTLMMAKQDTQPRPFITCVTVYADTQPRP